MPLADLDLAAQELRGCELRWETRAPGAGEEGEMADWVLGEVPESEMVVRSISAVMGAHHGRRRPRPVRERNTSRHVRSLAYRRIEDRDVDEPSGLENIVGGCLLVVTY